MNVQVKIGNPIILTDAEIEKYHRVVNAADNTGVMDEVIIGIDKLYMVCRGVKKTLKYPAGADVQWVIQKITDFSKTSSDHYKRADKRSEDFIALCSGVLSDGGDVAIEEKQIKGYYGDYKTCEVINVYLDKGDGHEFRACCEAGSIEKSCVERLRIMIEKEKQRRAKEAETARMRELARKNGLI